MQTAVFGLLVGLCFEPLHATAQTRCEVAAGSIVSAEGEISLLGAAGSIQFVAAGADTRLCPGETVLVGPRSRAALRLEDTGQVIRLDQGTTLRVLQPRQPGRPLLDLSRGIIELFSPGNRPLDIETPFVTAGVEGTEFFVLVDASRKIAEVGVIDGRVGVKNAQGRLSLGAGEAAIASPANRRAASRYARGIRSAGRSIIRRQCGNSPRAVPRSIPASTPRGKPGEPAIFALRFGK
jgi:hypothetical protein